MIVHYSLRFNPSPQAFAILLGRKINKLLYKLTLNRIIHFTTSRFIRDKHSPGIECFLSRFTVITLNMRVSFYTEDLKAW